MESKVCARCSTDRPREDWHPSQWAKGSWCRPCMSAYYKNRNADFHRVCPECDGAFTTKHPRKKFCTAECKLENQRAARASAAQAKRDARTCVHCGSAMGHRPTTAKWCSDRCGAQGNPNRRDIAWRCRIKKAYGLTKDEYDALFASQDSKCAICGSADPGSRRWNVDHDHTTGQVRGLLCTRCNTGIGQLQDSPTVLRSALEYVIRHRQMTIEAVA